MRILLQSDENLAVRTDRPRRAKHHFNSYPAMSEHTGRSLRPRKEGKSFAEMFQFHESDEDMGDGSGSGNGFQRKKLPPIEEPVSDSEYDPVEGKANPEAAESSSHSGDVLSEVDDGDPDPDALLDGSVVDVNLQPSGAQSRTVRDIRRSRTSKSSLKPSGQELVASFNFIQRRPGNRTVAANPVIGLLRARATPLYTFPGPSRRLSQKPSPFEEPQFVSTTGHFGSVAARVIKAWSWSVFPGPLWELLEDMAYFKEVAYTSGNERTRPVVHSDVVIPAGSFEVLESSYAFYLFVFLTIFHLVGLIDQDCVAISAF